MQVAGGESKGKGRVTLWFYEPQAQSWNNLPFSCPPDALSAAEAWVALRESWSVLRQGWKTATVCLTGVGWSFWATTVTPNKTHIMSPSAFCYLHLQRVCLYKTARFNICYHLWKLTGFKSSCTSRCSKKQKLRQHSQPNSLSDWLLEILLC